MRGKKEELSYVYAVDVTLGKGQEEKFLKKNKNRNIMTVKEKKLNFQKISGNLNIHRL